ncbi:MAG: protein-L-isoaspartate(D-aspartate) O-methyltransferase [Gammaproteobacteria bacterium]|nr:MAG: protein-L-isoaspartate(D-aspartate) O-methyltransferase [Gammaproteobacteria bacterium]
MFDLEGIGMTSRRTRERMIDRLKQQGIKNPLVLEAMRATPRHIFVEEALSSRAYEDTALPIGYGQTISQPYIVAKMTELLIESGVPDKVLEIGTGSGYQTAILSHIAPRIFSVERILPLQQQAKERIQALKMRNISFKYSDGGWGWPEYGPYNGILVAAAPAEIPHALLEQMADGAVMLIPVGGDRLQSLQRVVRKGNEFEVELIENVSFVPFLSGRGQ